MKTSIIFSLLLLNLFMLCARGGEVEQFIRETLEEQRARSECEPSEVRGVNVNQARLPKL